MIIAFFVLWWLCGTCAALAIVAEYAQQITVGSVIMCAFAGGFFGAVTFVVMVLLLFGDCVIWRRE